MSDYDPNEHPKGKDGRWINKNGSSKPNTIPDGTHSILETASMDVTRENNMDQYEGNEHIYIIGNDSPDNYVNRMIIEVDPDIGYSTLYSIEKEEDGNLIMRGVSNSSYYNPRDAWIEDERESEQDNIKEWENAVIAGKDVGDYIPAKKASYDDFTPEISIDGISGGEMLLTNDKFSQSDIENMRAISNQTEKELGQAYQDLAKSPNMLVRQALAYNPHIDEDTKYLLAQDEDPAVVVGLIDAMDNKVPKDMREAIKNGPICSENVEYWGQWMKDTMSDIENEERDSNES